MHHIYHTRALVLGSKNHGEAGKVFFLFTRELGMVYATASGVRKLESKLRFVLQDYSYVNIDLVRGKDFWRLTSASKPNECLEIKNFDGLKIFSKISLLLRRLLAGEEPNPELFEDFLRGVRVLSSLEDKEEIKNAETVIVLRMLHHLGYVGENEEVREVVTSTFFEEAILKSGGSRSRLLREINKALNETQL